MEGYVLDGGGQLVWFGDLLFFRSDKLDKAGEKSVGNTRNRRRRSGKEGDMPMLLSMMERLIFFTLRIPDERKV